MTSHIASSFTSECASSPCPAEAHLPSSLLDVFLPEVLRCNLIQPLGVNDGVEMHVRLACVHQFCKEDVRGLASKQC